MKKVEIIIDAGAYPRIKEVLDASGVKGYTILNIIEGKGEKGGHVKAIPELNSFEQYYIFTVCTAEEAESLSEALKPFIKTLGGLIFVSGIDKFFSN